MDGRQNEVVFVEQRCPGFGARSLRWVERQLRQKTLTRRIPSGDLLQFLQIADPGYRVVIQHLEIRLVPLTKKTYLADPRSRRVRQRNYAVAEFTPVRRRRGRNANAFECFEAAFE